MEVVEDVKDALIEAAAQLLRYHLGLPEPPPNYLNPNVLLGTVYGRCLRQLIGMQPMPCSYAIPQLSFEIAWVCVADLR